MTTFLEAVQAYVERKRSEGLNYAKAEQILLSLSRYVGHSALERVTARQVASFLDGPKTSPVSWEKKYGLLRAFFDFWLARGEMQILPLPAKRKTSPRVFIPYIYSQTEIRELLKAAQASQQEVWCRIDARTVRTFLIFLYGTGALLGEAHRLLLKDVNLKKGTVTIRGNQFNRSRTIPISSDLREILGRYMKARLRHGTNDPHFFVNKSGEGLNINTLSSTFKRIRRHSRVVRRDGAHYQPRLHDLRHTFAVHRIAGWIRHGADLNRMLPALAVYMGQAGLGSTERYLSLTPERFRTQLAKLSPKRGRKRWRDDAALMKFLAEL
ncbi:MAG: tyrosine-type recombinase/integrase [Terracidiphilus sp.]|jgi:site-specific recombinase XerD|nr:tyrosine-type recombinase/integrase [Terracidiphilus sp.]